jgi:hypothetical protein
MCVFVLPYKERQEYGLRSEASYGVIILAVRTYLYVLVCIIPWAYALVVRMGMYTSHTICIYIYINIHNPFFVQALQTSDGKRKELEFTITDLKKTTAISGEFYIRMCVYVHVYSHWGSLSAS